MSGQINKLKSDLVDWLMCYAIESDRMTFVVGVSGGIDSAVACRLCEMAAADLRGKFGRVPLPREKHPRVIAIAMPRQVEQSRRNGPFNRSLELCIARPNVDLAIVPIERMINAYESGVHGADEAVPLMPPMSTERLLFGNRLARIRTQILYDYAGRHNGLVVGTTNLIELKLGYFTKGGDGVADIRPFANLNKTAIVDLAKSYTRTDYAIPESIITARPSADLLPGQTDEEDLGMTYPEIEDAMRAMDEDELGADIELTKDQRRRIMQIKAAKNKTQHKHTIPTFSPRFNPG